MKSVTIAGRAKPLPGRPHGRGEVCVRGGLRETPASEVEETVLSKIHILGIAGTFMGGVAALARELDHEVEGRDEARSEERRVGKERVSRGRERWAPYHEKKQNHNK